MKGTRIIDHKLPKSGYIYHHQTVRKVRKIYVKCHNGEKECLCLEKVKRLKRYELLERNHDTPYWLRNPE